MFDDLFGPSLQQVRESHIHHATNYIALVLLLVEKGVITDDELGKARTRATHMIDQVVAEQREEAIAEYDKEHPGVRAMMERMLGQ